MLICLSSYPSVKSLEHTQKKPFACLDSSKKELQTCRTKNKSNFGQQSTFAMYYEWSLIERVLIKKACKKSFATTRKR